ncbi:MAG TPA: DUF2298 domain-containing protein [Oligoflexia bacterium]|nr:DUF2298 domain-containing protein [Oligoflexia bacterium]HMR25517.1 DUF2298 domain-containing protein [Oligoflexia bacterium]
MFYAYVLQWFLALFLIRLLVYVSIKQEYLSQYRAALGMPLFLAIWAFFYWIMGSFLPLYKGNIQVWVALAVSMVLLLQKPNNPILQNCKNYFIEHKFEQGLFWGTLLFTLFVRQHVPDMDSGEKYSDMAIFQAVLLDVKFPPVDRWLSGHPLNYYYFSHLLFVPIVRITGIPAEWVVNIITCTIPAILVSTGYAFLRQVRAKKGMAILGAFLIFFAGNWEWLAWLVKKINYGKIFWWWDSSRAIPNTITEFPYFSFLLGDMHAHYVSVAFVTISLMLMLRLREKFEQKLEVSKQYLFLVLPIVMGMHYMMNSWHLPFMILLCVWCFWSYPKYLILMLSLACLYFAPFWLHYHPPKNTIGLFYVKKSMRSPLLSFLLHWGPMFFMLMLIYVQRFINKNFMVYVKNNRRKISLIVFLSIVVLSISYFLLGATPMFMLLLIALFVLLGYLRELKNSWPVGVLLLSLLTIAGCEFITVDVTYGPKFYRMNTVFKFYYLAWWGMALSLPMLLSYEHVLKKTWAKGMLSFCVALSLYYPIHATSQRMRDGQRKVNSLDGMRHWSIVFPGHKQAIAWLKKNTDVQDIIWEMPGGGFSEYARMATFSGRPSVLGWVGHEQIWRDGGFYLANDRLQHFKKINENPSMTSVQEFIEQYQVDWIIVGNLERKDYSPELLYLLSKFPVVFDNKDVVIYKARNKD